MIREHIIETWIKNNKIVSILVILHSIILIWGILSLQILYECFDTYLIHTFGHSYSLILMHEKWRIVLNGKK